MGDLPQSSDRPRADRRAIAPASAPWVRVPLPASARDVPSEAMDRAPRKRRPLSRLPATRRSCPPTAPDTPAPTRPGRCPAVAAHAPVGWRVRSVPDTSGAFFQTPPQCSPAICGPAPRTTAGSFGAGDTRFECCSIRSEFAAVHPLKQSAAWKWIAPGWPQCSPAKCGIDPASGAPLLRRTSPCCTPLPPADRRRALPPSASNQTSRCPFPAAAA